MAMDAQARTRAPDQPAREDDYEALLAALSASARGRIFLAEYARRNRNADTERVLTALLRLETLIASEPVPSPAESEDELRHLAVVPPLDEPELPIPSPTAQRPLIALAQPPDAPLAEQAASAIPAVDWYVEATIDAPQEAAATQPPQVGYLRDNALAHLMALSEEERLALFS